MGGVGEHGPGPRGVGARLEATAGADAKLGGVEYGGGSVVGRERMSTAKARWLLDDCGDDAGWFRGVLQAKGI